jgi:hypothetical protein
LKYGKKKEKKKNNNKGIFFCRPELALVTDVAFTSGMNADAIFIAIGWTGARGTIITAVSW